MVDRSARDQYAELLRHFVAGRMTNFEYEESCDQIFRTNDEAVHQIYCAMWPTYCDIRKHTMTGDYALSKEGRRLVAQWILFLHSDLEYEWPVPGMSGCLLNILTFGFWSRLQKHKRARLGFSGNHDVWPFFHLSNFDEALKHPKLLRGAS